MAVGLPHYLVVAALLFTIGVFGIFINRKNVIIILMSIELILLAVNINLVAFSVFLGDLVGQVFALFILTVLDAGLPGHWRGFSLALSRLGYTPADIDAVLITHHHPDHRGNAERLRSSGARVLAHAADAPYVRGERRLGGFWT